MTSRRRSLSVVLGSLVTSSLCLMFFAGCAEDISGDDDNRPENIKLVLQSVDPAYVERPAWIDDDTIIFSWTQDTPSEQLWTIKVSGGSPARFITDNANRYLHPVYSQALDMVAFEVIESGFGGSNVDAITLDRKFRKRYVSETQVGSATYPAWGPDGKSIGYLATTQADGPRFEMVELDDFYSPPGVTDNIETVYLGKGTQATRVAWLAPAGGDPFAGKVAFNRIPTSAPNGTEIFYYNLDTDQTVHLTDETSPDGTNDNSPNWSPDGKYIVYSSFRDVDFRHELYVVSASSKQVSRITNSGDDEIEPAWSPDGTRIAYVSDGDLYVMTLSTTSLPD